MAPIVAPPLQPGEGPPGPRAVAPSPFTPSTWPPGPSDPVAGFDFQPRDLCVGGELKLVGFNYPDDYQWTAWLQRARPRWIPGMTWAGPGDAPYAVRLGEVPKVGPRRWEATFTLAERMGPVSTGGELTVEPGDFYTVLLFARDRSGAQHMGTTAGFVAGRPGPNPGACIAVSPPPLPASRKITLSAPIACLGDTLTVTGADLEPGEALVTIEHWATRFGGVEAELATVTVAPDGSFQLPVPLRPYVEGQTGPAFAEGGEYRLRVYDQHRTRQTSTSFQVCHGGRP